MVAPLHNRPVDEAERHLHKAVAMLYRCYRRDGDDPAEAMSGALNMARMMLGWLARDKGYRLDYAEEPQSALDVEYVAAEEFAERPEVAWFAFAAEMTREDLTPEEALAEVKRFRKAAREHPEWLFERSQR